jgi:histidinol phosphatase-like PHP family hydrolase
MKFHVRSHPETRSDRSSESGSRRDRIAKVAEFIASGGYSLLTEASTSKTSGSKEASNAGRLATIVETGGYELLTARGSGASTATTVD